MKLFNRAAFAILFYAVTTAPTGAFAEDLKLKKIMQDLAGEMEAIVRAISLEDYGTVHDRALGIAGHEKPPVEERMMILKFLQADAAGFKAADGVVHDSAARLAAAADKKDHYGVVGAFMDVLNGCVDCHAKYRGRVLEQFYRPGAE